MAWSEDKRARFQTLKSARLRGALTEAEHAELRSYAEELDREEEAALAAFFAQKDIEIARSKRELEETLGSAETLEPWSGIRSLDPASGASKSTEFCLSIRPVRGLMPGHAPSTSGAR